MTQIPGQLIELGVEVDGEAAEAVVELFERYGGGAVVQIDVATGPESGDSLAVPRTHVRTYIPVDDVEARARLEVGLWHLGRLYPIPEATVRRLSRANWAEAWKRHYAPQRIGRHCVVVPSWCQVEPEAGDCLIMLDPGMCFGTGLHPTTRLCLAALEDLVRAGDEVLDVGTGTGILAIAAARMGASRVVALDISSEAVATAASNAQSNGVQLETFAGELGELPPCTFDVLAANLLANTVIELAPQFRARLAPGGRLVASGILQDQRDEVLAALRAANLDITDERSSGDWLAVLAKRVEA